MYFPAIFFRAWPTQHLEDNYRLIAITLRGCVPEYQWEGFNTVQLSFVPVEYQFHHSTNIIVFQRATLDGWECGRYSYRILFLFTLS